MANNRAEKISSEAIISKICKLVNTNDFGVLKELMAKPENKLLKYKIVSFLATDNSITDVLSLIKQLDLKLNRDDIIIGLAWGGHTQTLSHYMKGGHIPALEIKGYALGRHIEQVNKFYTKDESSVYIAACAYPEGGHVENLPDTLELITLTTARSLRESLAFALKEKIDSIDVELLLAKAEKLTLLMQHHKISYQDALNTLNDIETQEDNTKKSANKTFASLIASDSIRLFHQAASEKLSIYQKQAVEQLGQFGVTEYVMLNWKPHDSERYFSFNHFYALRLLLSEQHLDPIPAIKEINQLSIYHVNALIELYSLGLRGEHLRKWQHETRLRFSPENLEQLLRVTLYEKKEPVAALNEISGSKPQAVRIIHN